MLRHDPESRLQVDICTLLPKTPTSKAHLLGAGRLFHVRVRARMKYSTESRWTLPGKNLPLQYLEMLKDTPHTHHSKQYSRSSLMRLSFSASVFSSTVFSSSVQNSCTSSARNPNTPPPQPLTVGPAYLSSLTNIFRY